MKKYLITIIILLSTSLAYSQIVYEHITRTNIYDFLDELANEKAISLNSAIKPYSRTFIAEKLLEAYEQKDELSKRMVKEIEFYMKDYRLETQYVTKGMKPGNLFHKKDHVATALNPVGLFYRDSLFAASIRPIWGIHYFNNSNGDAFHRWGGLEGFAYVGKVFGAYSSLRDNRESQRITAPDFFNQRQGVPVKNAGEGAVDYSEARGGMMFSWKWGAVGVIKDHMQWGNAYYGNNIFSGRTPSFAHIKLQIKPVEWFEFNYIHGWLVSQVVDSSRSYWDGDIYRTIYHNKYIAANMFTFTPVKHLNLSIGNSVVYSAENVHLAYLVPFLFYKSVDHTLNATNADGYNGQNSQLFFDISSRNIRHLHLFLTVFVDEFSARRVGNPDEHNFISYKGGVRLSNWPFKNISLITEYTITNPMVYQHNISTTTFESNLFNMGHYMRDNSEDLYIALKVKPIRGLVGEFFYNYARHGDDEKYGDYDPVDEVPFLENTTWQKSVFGLKARYEVVNNAYVFLGVVYSDVQTFDLGDRTAQDYLEKFTPELWWGQTTTFEAGFNVGF
jgi:hypothetical protein